MKREILAKSYLIMCIVVSTILITLLVISKMREDKLPEVGYFEYIMVVDGTDSVNKYIIMDDKHKMVGKVTADKLDSLIDHNNQ